MKALGRAQARAGGRRRRTGPRAARRGRAAEPGRPGRSCSGRWRGSGADELRGTRREIAAGGSASAGRGLRRRRAGRAGEAGSRVSAQWLRLRRPPGRTVRSWKSLEPFDARYQRQLLPAIDGDRSGARPGGRPGGTDQAPRGESGRRSGTSRPPGDCAGRSAKAAPGGPGRATPSSTKQPPTNAGRARRKARPCSS